jgi:hypothetical protein
MRFLEGRMNAVLCRQALSRAGLWVFFLVTLGCGSSPGVSPQFTPASLAVKFVTPTSGPPGTPLTISGTGFLSGAIVSVGGVDAGNVVRVSELVITATAPPHDAGSVDVVVTNPGGERSTLTGGFSYPVPQGTGVTASLTVRPAGVAPGGQLQVDWAISGPGFDDWIGLFRVGDPNIAYLDYQYTTGRTTGTQTWVAPSQPGQYQFRYLPNDGYIDVARSEPITVQGPAIITGAGAQTLIRRGRGGVRR